MEDSSKSLLCQKCGGQMVYEKFYCQEGYFWGHRCIKCGDIIDAMVMENRGFSEQSIVEYLGISYPIEEVITRSSVTIRWRDRVVLYKPKGFWKDDPFLY